LCGYFFATARRVAKYVAPRPARFARRHAVKF
jgi:hypothetical protein